MKRKVLIVALLIPFVLSMTSFLLAAEVHHIHGEVTAVDAAARTFTVKEKLSNGQTKDVAFTAGEKMKVTIHGKAGKFEEVKPGDSIHVRFVIKGKVNQAEEIAIVAAPAKKP